MTVQDVIDSAAYSEIAGTAIFSKDDTVKVPAITVWINQALIEISKKIPLITKEQVINLITDSLDTGLTYALPDDCLQVVSVYGENGQELPINDETDKFSVFTPTFNRILVPGAQPDSAISVIYTAKPEKVSAVTDVLPVNEVFLDSILMFLGYKAYMPTNSTLTKNSISDDYLAKFKLAVNYILESGMFMPDGIKEHSYFDAGGWR